MAEERGSLPSEITGSIIESLISTLNFNSVEKLKQELSPGDVAAFYQRVHKTVYACWQADMGKTKLPKDPQPG